MRLKSFHAATNTEAMRLVREALGEDAIIVATREDEGGGVRITAATDETQPSRKPVPAPPEHNPDLIEQMADALHYHRLHPALAETLLATATGFAEDDAQIALAAACDAHIGFRPLSPEQAGRPIILVGPPGAGKTLTIAKIATAARLQKKPVTVITTDLVRAGGLEQIAAFTRLLKVRLLEIEQPEAVADTLGEIAGKELVLVDTAGRNPYHPDDREEFTRMIGKNQCDISLVLGCGQDAAEGTDLARAFSSLGADRLILTRVDLARRLGPMITIAHESGLGLAAISQSSNAAVPLQPMNPILLARCLLQPVGLLQDAVTPSSLKTPARHHA
jgi:flagellar biosynthesis protein FlhF